VTEFSNSKGRSFISKPKFAVLTIIRRFSHSETKLNNADYLEIFRLCLLPLPFLIHLSHRHATIRRYTFMQMTKMTLNKSIIHSQAREVVDFM
jgi:hypothetical protein